MKTASVIGFLIVLVVVMTWPLLLHFDDFLVGYLDHPGLQGDLFFQWNIDRQMEAGELDYLHSPMTLHPVGERFRAKVAFSLHQILYVAFQPLLSLIPARNLAMVVILIGNGAAAWFLFRKRSESVLFALACTVLWTVGPWVQLKLDQGFMQKITLFHFPLMLYLLFRFLEDRRFRDALWYSLVLIVAVLVYPPFAVFNVAFSAVVAAGWFFRRGSLRGLRYLVGPLVVAVVLVGCLVWVVGAEDFLLGDRMPIDGEAFRAQGGYLDLFHPIRGYPYVGTFGDRPFQKIVEKLPLGLPVIPFALAFLAVVTRRRLAPWLFAGAVAVILVMAGPFLMRGGDLVLLGEKPIPLPFFVLEHLPFSQVFRFPIRLFPWMLMALLLASCEAINWVRTRSITAGSPRTSAVLTVVAAGLLMLEPLVIFPEYRHLRVRPFEAPWYCEALGGDRQAAVLHLPYYPPGPHDYLMAAVQCDRPIVNAWSWRPSPLDIPGPREAKREGAAFAERLRTARVAAVVIHPDSYDYVTRHPEITEPSLPGAGGSVADVQRWLQAQFGAPLTSTRGPEEVFLVAR